MLTRRFTLLVTAALIGAAQPRAVAAPADGEILMASWPCLSPDGKTLAFEWRDDLWSVPAAGGLAERLTAHPARDSFPAYSPDGKTLYFCSSRAGFLQLFSMPAGGGPAAQHSFHSEGASLEDITPDGTRALVRGLRDEPGFRPERLIEIDLRRDAPESYLFNEKGQSARYSPDGGKVLFCREGEQLYRKGYRGPGPPRSGSTTSPRSPSPPWSRKIPKRAGRCGGRTEKDSTTSPNATAPSTCGPVTSPPARIASSRPSRTTAWSGRPGPPTDR